MFCAGGNNIEKGICSGDSGGPVVNQDQQQCGIVSWAEGCAPKEKPDVFTDVSQFISWINEKMNDFQ